MDPSSRRKDSGSLTNTESVFGLPSVGSRIQRISIILDIP